MNLHRSIFLAANLGLAACLGLASCSSTSVNNSASDASVPDAKLTVQVIEASGGA